MGNQHPTAVQCRDLQAVGLRTEVIEKYGVGETEKKVIQHFDCDDTWTITYPTNDERGREIYQGQMKDGLRHGQGMLLWKDGVTYEGAWYQDRIEGQWGTMAIPDSRTYTGSWKNSLPEGVGVLIVPAYDGLRYEGEWKNGYPEGKGKNLFGRKDQRVSYEGEWKAGKREGHGVMLWWNGSVYMGQWAAGSREGYGVWYNSTQNGGERYSGMWKADKREDLEGRLVYKNGDEYRGPFANGKRHGEGVLVFRHGRKVKQMWRNGEEVECPLPTRLARRWFGGKVPQSECARKTGRVQSLVVLCIEAVGSNRRLLKKLGMKRTKGLFNQSKKVAKQRRRQPTSLYSSLLAAAPSAVISFPSSSSSSPSSPSLLLPMELMESLHFFVSSRQAMKVAAQEKRAQREIKLFPVSC